MKKTLLSIVFVGAALASAAIPSQASALKVKVEPSISFNQTHVNHHAVPRTVVRQRVVHRNYYYDPYYGTYYYYPEVEEYVEYHPPRRSSSFFTWTNWGLNFKFF